MNRTIGSSSGPTVKINLAIKVVCDACNCRRRCIQIKKKQELEDLANPEQFINLCLVCATTVSSSITELLGVIVNEVTIL